MREIATVTLAPVLFVIVLRGPRQRLVERGQLHRWPGRAGRRHHGDGAAAVLITFWQYRNACVTAPEPGLLRAATRWTWLIAAQPLAPSVFVVPRP